MSTYLDVRQAEKLQRIFKIYKFLTNIIILSGEMPAYRRISAYSGLGGKTDIALIWAKGGIRE